MSWRAAALSLCLLVACQQAPDQPASRATAAPSEPRVEDARYLARRLEELHPDLYHWVSKERFRDAADELIATAPELTDEEFLVEAARLVALPALGGRDGHSGLFPAFAGASLHSFPIHLYDFSDGLFVVDALDESLIGREIVAIDGVPLRVVRRKVDPLMARDNETTVLARFPTMVTTSELLQGLGITDDRAATFTLRRPDGGETQERLDPIPIDQYHDWIGHSSLWGLPEDPKVLYLSRLHDPAWVKWLPRSRTIYAQYNVVGDPTPVVDGIRRHLREAERVVLDLRHNGGGDNTKYYPIVDLLGRRSLEGKVYVLAGRTTFSAAGNLAGELDHSTSAIFVGEPPGGAPNQFGDSQPIELPNAGFSLHVSVYWVEAVPGDERLAIRPDVPVALSSEDFFSHRDPALEAIVR